MRIYEKPVLEIIELRPEERLAGTSVLVKDVYRGWNYTIYDHDQNGAKDHKIDYFEAWDDNGRYQNAWLPTKKVLHNFLKDMGLNFGNWWKK